MTELRRVRVDTHTHSEYSPDSRTPLAEQARALRDAAIDIVCATDHNTIDGALRLREMADGFRVIVGEEISSRDGEIIGLFLERAVTRDRSGEETIARIHDQGGIVIVPACRSSISSVRLNQTRCRGPLPARGGYAPSGSGSPTRIGRG